jgi:Aerobic-type carbon monoxide dehydrogenase, large subunit CoxL/CutL homologs
LTETGIGASVIRKEAWEKVTGQAKYTDDFITAGIYTVGMATSTYAHAKIIKIDSSEACALEGVKVVLTGESFPVLCGPLIEDRPPLARGKVRYYGEPVALVVAKDEFAAAKAVSMIRVEYEPLPTVNAPAQAIKDDAPVLHEEMITYRLTKEEIHPKLGTNICDHKKIRKGDAERGFAQSDVIVEASFTLPQSDHIAMETRAVHAKIAADGTVWIKTSSQSPFSVKKIISNTFHVDLGKIVVEVPLVGGGFGGKAPVQLEILAYMASQAVGGKEVRLINSRENDIASSPCRMGLEAKIRLGASKDGMLKAAQMTNYLDCGAYSDIGPTLVKAIIVDCTGPYNIPNVCCDAYCVYTNHPYATSYRGFSHSCSAFCIERTMDKLAKELNMDSAQLRAKNALRPGDTSPTQVKITTSLLGDLNACINRVKTLIGWEEGTRIVLGENKIRAKGIACLWKTSNSPPDATSGALITFNNDGSVNLNVGCVEIGPGMKTTAAQILADKMKMDISRIYVNMDVNTRISPEHWKTVASMTTYMVGRAVLRAAEDAIKQLKSLGGAVLRCPPEDLEVGNEMVYVRHDPSLFVPLKDLAHGYQYPNGNSVEGQVLGRGTFIMGDLNLLDKDTGRGKSGPYWTVGAQAVEVEFDRKEYTYRLIKAATVLDAGKVLNPKMAEGLVKGGMCMGLGLATREYFAYGTDGRVLDTSLRTYKVMHFGETPQYLVDFVETPQIDSPYGSRGIAEHGTVGIPAALANALSAAAQAELNELPLNPETIWRIKTGGSYDSV